VTGERRIPEGLEFREGYAFYHPVGPTSVPAFIAILGGVMEACRDRGAVRLLVDLRDLSHPPLRDADRYDMGAGLAAFWDRSIRLAWIGRADQMDPKRFGVMVATQRGLSLSAGHEDEGEALRWLFLDRDAPPSG
jgi:hypothetical protein